MAEVITLSSDDEESVPPPKKKVKLITLDKSSNTKNNNSLCIILSDEEGELKPKSNSVPSVPPEGAYIPKVETVIVNNINHNSQEDSKVTVSTAETNNSAPNSVAAINIEEVLSENDVNTNTSKTTSEVISTDKTDYTNSDSVWSNLQGFIDVCRNTLVAHRQTLDSKVPVIKKYFEYLERHNCDFTNLLATIKNSKEKAQSGEANAATCFYDIYQWLKTHANILENEKISNGKHEKIIRKLSKALDKINRKIKQLDEAEVDFDDEENSHYLQASLYKARASKIYSKLCQYRKENPKHRLLTSCRLDFAGSHYTEINQALNRKFKDNSVFPTFYDVDKCIRKCVAGKNLKISESSLNSEIKHCFESLGNMLQKRRKAELRAHHFDFLPFGVEDPAKSDPVIEQKLNANYKDANTRIQGIVDKYVNLQNKGVEPEVSSDSDDSEIDTDNENEEKHENI